MSIASRLVKLEKAAAGAAPDRCPDCGADWPGSVYASVEDDGTSTPRCIVCDAERLHPGHPLKGYAAGLMKCL